MENNQIQVDQKRKVEHAIRLLNAGLEIECKKCLEEVSLPDLLPIKYSILAFSDKANPEWPTPEAMDLLRSAYELSGDEAHLNNYLAALFESSSHAKLEELVRALPYVPQKARVLYIQSLIATFQPDKARLEYEKISHQLAKHQSISLAGRIAQLSGDSIGALRHYRLLIAEKGATVDDLINYVELQLRNGKINSVHHHIERLARLEAQNPFVVRILLRYYLIESRLSDARELVGRCLNQPRVISEVLQESMLTLQKVNDYDLIPSLYRRCLKELRAGNPVVSPQTLIGLVKSPTLQLRIAKIWSKAANRNRTNRICLNRVCPTLKRRIGFITSDLYAHATTHLIMPLIVHKSDKIDRVLFDCGSKNDCVNKEIRNNVKNYWNIENMSDEAAACLILQNADILIDLKGYTENARPALVSSLQGRIPIVMYLGYPATTGESERYLLADQYTVPSSHERYYTEKILRLKHSFQFNQLLEAAKPPAHSKINRQTIKLGCHSGSYKITSDILQIWAELSSLQNVSSIEVLVDNDLAESNIKKKFSQFGGNEEKLVFLRAVDKKLHLERLADLDLFLDTFPCGAHTLAFDCLSQSVPILTISGRTFSSRVSASLLNALGLDELITDSKRNYNRKGYALCDDKERLLQIAKKIYLAVKSSEPNLNHKITEFENVLASIPMGS